MGDEFHTNYYDEEFNITNYIDVPNYVSHINTPNNGNHIDVSNYYVNPINTPNYVSHINTPNNGNTADIPNYVDPGFYNGEVVFDYLDPAFSPPPPQRLPPRLAPPVLHDVNPDLSEIISKTIPSAYAEAIKPENGRLYQGGIGKHNYKPRTLLHFSPKSISMKIIRGHNSLTRNTLYSSDDLHARGVHKRGLNDEEDGTNALVYFFGSLPGGHPDVLKSNGKLSEEYKNLIKEEGEITDLLKEKESSDWDEYDDYAYSDEDEDEDSQPEEYISIFTNVEAVDTAYEKNQYKYNITEVMTLSPIKVVEIARLYCIEKNKKHNKRRFKFEFEYMRHR